MFKNVAAKPAAKERSRKSVMFRIILVISGRGLRSLILYQRHTKSIFLGTEICCYQLSCWSCWKEAKIDIVKSTSKIPRRDSIGSYELGVLLLLDWMLIKASDPSSSHYFSHGLEKMRCKCIWTWPVGCISVMFNRSWSSVPLRFLSMNICPT